MERTEDCENVVSRDPQDTVCEEDKAPWDTQEAAQSKHDHDIPAVPVDVVTAWVGFLVTDEQCRYDDESGKGKQENQRIAAYVYHPVDGTVGYPAPSNTSDVW